MPTNSRRPEHRDAALHSLNAALEAVELAKELSTVAPARAVFGTVSIILTMTRVSLLLVCIGRLHDEMNLGHIDRRG